jgi:hypothetical protein
MGKKGDKGDEESATTPASAEILALKAHIQLEKCYKINLCNSSLNCSLKWFHLIPRCRLNSRTT